MDWAGVGETVCGLSGVVLDWLEIGSWIRG